MDVDQSLTIEQYVNDVLLGEGVSATNINFIGSTEQIGYMTGGDDVGFPIDGGLVLEFGQRRGCLLCGSRMFELFWGQSHGQRLAGHCQQRASIDWSGVLGDQRERLVRVGIRLRSCRRLRVVQLRVWVQRVRSLGKLSVQRHFRLLPFGAGINGPYDAPGAFPGQAINIASVPDSDPELPITISSVNGALNAEYYILNEAPDDVCMNGYTTVLTAVYPVICGETYHIKLAIGDGTDTILDSVVILEEGSFGSPIPTTYESQAAPECDPDPNDDQIIYCAWEDCGPATITISRPCAVSSLFPFPFDLTAAPGSEATLDEDLLGLPSSAAIPVGEYGISLTFEVPQDDIDEGTETLYLKVTSGTIESEITIIIYDTPPFEATMPELVTVPCDQSEEVCIELIQDPAYAYPPVDYYWTINGVDFGSDQCVTYQSLTSSLMEVYMEDGCGREVYLQGLFEVPYDALELTMPNDTLLCNGAAAVMELEIQGGQPPYQIQWDDFNDEELIHVVDPDESTEYEVVVVDNCDYSEFASTKVDVQTVKTTIVRESLGDDTYVFDVLTDPVEPFEGAYFYVWEFGDGNVAYERAPTHTYDGLSQYEAKVYVTTNIGCSDDAVMDIYGDVLFYIPTAFTPDNDGLNDALEITGRQVRLFEIWIYNRWGEEVYHSTDMDAAWVGDVDGGTHYAPNGVYHWVIKAAGFDTDAQEFRGFVHLMR